MANKFSLQDFLVELGQAVAQTQVATMRQYVDTLLAQDTLDVEIPIGEDKVKVDGVSLLPQGLPQLDELSIQCETEVSAPSEQVMRMVDRRKGEKDENAVVPQLKMSMSKGLFGKGMHVKIDAKYKRGDPVESIEVLRDHANQKIVEALAELNAK